MTIATIWFCIGLFLLIAEALLPGLILFFFGFGAWITALVIWQQGSLSLTIQLILFISSSSILLLTLRRYIKSIFLGRIVANENIDENDFDGDIGQTAVVKIAITPNKKGKVEFHGSLWMAESDQTLEEEKIVKIIGKNNITLKVAALSN
jgi:membrane protein implicated in regulation of membrane protease activity